MSDLTRDPEHIESSTELLDNILREVLPEIKLALGDAIDRENSRALPERYARLLPDTLLIVTLNAEAAEALAPLSTTIERDLSDSVARHGLLYDRRYRVQLRRSDDPGAPTYRVSAHAGFVEELEGRSTSATGQPASPADHVETAGSSSSNQDLPSATAAIPMADPDATRLDLAGPPGWSEGQWILVVESVAGEEMQAFRIVDPFTTVGRRTDDPELQTTIALADMPHLSRRQLVMLFEARDGLPGFRVYNVGLNALHTPEREVPGARAGREIPDLDRIPETSTVWIEPGVPLRIGEHGPVLRIEEIPPDMEEGDDEKNSVGGPHDPDATVHD